MDRSGRSPPAGNARRTAGGGLSGHEPIDRTPLCRGRAGDHLLEAAARPSEALAQLRWHWTLDESNPERVSLREYARSVGRDYKTIYACANGYAACKADGGSPINLSEAIEQAGVSANKAAVTEAVAEARGISVQTARKKHSGEIREIRDMAEASLANPTPTPQTGGRRGVQPGTGGERKALSALTLGGKGQVGK